MSILRLISRFTGEGLTGGKEPIEMVGSPMGGLSFGEIELGPCWKGGGGAWEPPFRLHSSHDGRLWICEPPCDPGERGPVPFEPSWAKLSNDTHLEWVGWGVAGIKSKTPQKFCQEIHIFSTCYSSCGRRVDRRGWARRVDCSPIIGLSNCVVENGRPLGEVWEKGAAVVNSLLVR